MRKFLLKKVISNLIKKIRLQVSISDANQQWSRPPLKKIDPSVTPLVFQQLDIDHYIGKLIKLKYYNLSILYNNRHHVFI